MKQIKTILIISLIVFTSISVNNIQADYGNIGISSTPIVIRDALRNATYHRTLTIHNQANDSTDVSLNATGHIEDWIKFCDYNDPSINFDNLTVPGIGVKKIIVNISVPEKAMNGNYNATIIVSEIGGVVDGNGSAVVTFMYPLSVTVIVTGEQNLNATIDKLYIDDNEVEYPVNTVIHFLNTGNVIAEPKIYVKITKNGIPVAELSDTSQKIGLNEFKIIELTWESSGMVPGEYIGNVTITLGDKTILTKDLTFNLFKVGTLSRHGVITSIAAIGNTTIGENITIMTKFSNRGEIQLSAKFVGKVYRDGKHIDTIESLETKIDKGAELIYWAYYLIPGNGNYVIEGTMQYGDPYTIYKETNVTKIVFTVGSSFSLGMLEIGGILIFVLVVIILILQKKRIINIPNMIKRKTPTEQSSKVSLRAKK